MSKFVIDGIQDRARPSWDETFLGMAALVAKRGTCPRLQVGALLVRDTVPLSCGYNGAVRGAPHCVDVGCSIQHLNGRDSCQRAVHAEANAIFNAGRIGISVAGTTLYCTHAPCQRCADILIQSGIARVVYESLYGSSKGLDALVVAGVKTDMIVRPKVTVQSTTNAAFTPYFF